MEGCVQQQVIILLITALVLNVKWNTLLNKFQIIQKWIYGQVLAGPQTSFSCDTATKLHSSQLHYPRFIIVYHCFNDDTKTLV